MTSSTSVDTSLEPLNAGTAKLIRLRVERAVRSGILRWGGLPAGGAGTLVFLLTLLVWIPQQAKQTDWLVNEFEELLGDYLGETATIFPEFGEQLYSIVRRSVNETAEQSVTSGITQWSRQEISKTLEDQVEKAVSGELSEALAAEQMAAQIEIAVTATLQSDNFELLRAAIKPALQPIAERMSKTITSNAERTVLSVTVSMSPEQVIDKGSVSELYNILVGLESRPSSDDELALSFYLAVKGSRIHEYRSRDIGIYLTLRDIPNVKVRYALILDVTGRFVALTDISQFASVLNEKGEALVSALNGEYASLVDAKDKMANLFGADSIAYLDERLTIREALTDEALPRLDGQAIELTHRVAVVGGDDKSLTFRGVTSRCHLLEALLPDRGATSRRCSVKSP